MLREVICALDVKSTTCRAPMMMMMVMDDDDGVCVLVPHSALLVK